MDNPHAFVKEWLADMKKKYGDTPNQHRPTLAWVFRQLTDEWDELTEKWNQ